VAVASADVVLVGGDLRKLPEAVAFGRATLQVIWQNILGFALVFNVLAVAAAATGWIGPVAAAVLHQVSSLTVVLNSLRLLVDAAAWRQWLEGAGYQVARRWRPIAAAAGGLLLAAYAISGLHVVAVGEVAVVQQFGRVAAIEPPGLHFRLPYPLASHQTLRPGEVRRVELGFRTAPGAFPEPPAYDWNVQHRGGRYERQPDEATVWSGDESIADVNLVVQYRVADPRAALFAVGRSLPGGGSKWDALVRALAEEALRAEMSRRGSDELLSDRRSEIEAAMRTRLAQRLADCGTGFELVAVALGDVHPPLEVVEAFREVTKALEEKEARINQAEAEQFEIEARTRGDAVLRVLSAEGAATDRVLRAEGAAARFTAVAAAYAAAPAVTAMRLYLAAMDEALAGRRKVIVDRAPPGSRRVLWLGPGGALNVAPAAVAPPPSPEPTGGIAPP
jgi:HflK protein